MLTIVYYGSNMSLRKFPHFYRIFPEPLFRFFVGMLWGGIISIIGFSIGIDMLQNKRVDRRLLDNVLREPFSPASHMALASQYLGRNKDAAKYEYEVADSLFLQATESSTVRLGIQSSPLETWRDVTSFSDSIKNDIAMWEKVFAVAPDYYYSSVRLSLLHYQLGEKEQSKQYIEYLKKESANPKEVIELEKQLQ